jgi:SAM-dependent methyltransferase
MRLDVLNYLHALAENASTVSPQLALYPLALRSTLALEYGYSILRCTDSHAPAPFRVDHGSQSLTCPHGSTFRIVEDIPRFAPASTYASSFGLQWARYPKTQLDSYTGVPISRERLTRIAGGSLEVFRGRQVLEAGCGAGRFTEILLEVGASVFAVDLSSAIEVNHENFNGWPGYFACQADIRRIPVELGQFDAVVCIGVIQHTPNSEETIAALCTYLRPGGLLVLDHYTYGYPSNLSRRLLRAMLLRMPVGFRLLFCRVMTTLLWPVHRLTWSLVHRQSAGRLTGRIRRLVLRWSPIVDYQDSYPQLGPARLKAWAVLDTHDTLTDAYKHMRSAEEISSCLRQCGMVDIEVCYGGNGVEARARTSSSRQR